MDLNSLLALGSIGAFLAKALPIFLIVNAILSGVSLALNKLRDASILKGGAFFTSFGKIMDVFSKITDFLSANKQH